MERGPEMLGKLKGFYRREGAEQGSYTSVEQLCMQGQLPPGGEVGVFFFNF